MNLNTILNELHKAKPAVVFLQETHFKTGTVPILHDKHYPHIFHATNPISKSKGISSLLHKNADFTISQQQADTEGRYLFLKGHLAGNPITVTFCQYLIDELKSFASGYIVLGGAFNIALNPLQDASDGKSGLPYNKLRKIKTILTSLTLVDTWRLTLPISRPYTTSLHASTSYSFLKEIFLSYKLPR